MTTKFDLENLKEEAELIVKKCLNYNFETLSNFDPKKLFHNKDLKIVGDNIISKEITVYLEEKTNIKVISEENFYKLDLTFFEDDIYWLIDPIDGSANLSRKLSHSYISVCLISKEGFPLISVIGSINENTIRSCFLEKERLIDKSNIFNLNEISLNDLFITSGFPLFIAKEDLNDYVSKLNLFKKVRMYGSAVGSILLVADKKIDVYYEKAIFSWDVAGALLEVLMKGGDYVVRSIDKKLSTLEVIATSKPELINTLIEKICGDKNDIWSRRTFYTP